jgi:hypothetical protein
MLEVMMIDPYCTGIQVRQRRNTGSRLRVTTIDCERTGIDAGLHTFTAVLVRYSSGSPLSIETRTFSIKHSRLPKSLGSIGG